MRRILGLAFVIVAALLAALPLLGAPRCDAHEGATVRAALEIGRDGRFDVRVTIDTEHLPAAFGADATGTAASQAPVISNCPPGLDPAALGVLRAAAAGLSVEFDGRGVPADASWTAPRRDGVLDLRLTGTAPGGAKSVTLRNTLRLGDWAAGVRYEGREGETVRFLGEGEAFSPVAIDAAYVTEAPGALQFVAAGFHHILPAGLDHILFVLALFLLSPKPRALLAQVTSFTLAHTATLALSVLGAVRLPSSVVEPIIAASLAYVAIENLCTTEVRRSRIAVVFAFGLLHGLGFAGGLADLGIPEGGRVVALLSFNAGVELGQLAVVGAAWALLAWPMRSRPWYRRAVVVPGSVAIAAAGLWWTVVRIVG